jgi:hypothetical protein
VNPDFVDLLRALSDAEARFLVVGAYAVSLHSRPRATGDLDLWIATDPGNAARVMAALRDFGAPLEEIGEPDLQQPEMVFQLGVPPRRIDILTSLTGLRFEGAWPNRVVVNVGGTDCPFLGRDDLVRNKRAVGRPRDLADLEALGERP